jgi:hypothetical protein
MHHFVAPAHEEVSPMPYSQPTPPLNTAPWSSWLRRAARLPGRSLHVAIALVFEAMAYDETSVRLPHYRLAELGVDRWAARRALRNLEKAGLITTMRDGHDVMVAMKPLSHSFDNGRRLDVDDVASAVGRGVEELVREAIRGRKQT